MIIGEQAVRAQINSLFIIIFDLLFWFFVEKSAQFTLIFCAITVN